MGLVWTKWKISVTAWPYGTMRCTVYRKNRFNGKLQFGGDYKSVSEAAKEKQRLNQGIFAKLIKKLNQ